VTGAALGNVSMEVDRCVCFETTFERLKQYVDAHGGREQVDFDQLQTEFRCGRGCGLCVPYIRLMLRTGRTRFPVNAPAASNTKP